MAGCNSVECNFHETPNMYPDLSAALLNATSSNKQQFRLNKINEIKNHFVAEIKEIELMSKRLFNSIESKIPEALINTEISHEDFMTIIIERNIENQKKALE